MTFRFHCLPLICLSVALLLTQSCTGDTPTTPVPTPRVAAHIFGTVAVPGSLAPRLGVQVLKAAGAATVEMRRVDNDALVATVKTDWMGGFDVPVDPTIAAQGVVLVKSDINGLALQNFAPTSSADGVDLTAGTTTLIEGVRTMLGNGTPIGGGAALKYALSLLLDQRTNMLRLAHSFDNLPEVDQRTELDALQRAIRAVLRLHVNATIDVVDRAAPADSGLSGPERARLAVRTYGQLALRFADVLAAKGTSQPLAASATEAATDMNAALALALVNQLPAMTQEEQAAFKDIALVRIPAPPPEASPAP